MIDVVVAPDPLPLGRPMLFLAGGITDCPDWQSEVIRLLDPLPKQWAVLNPRREHFPIHDPSAALAQLGAWSMTQRRIFVGADEDYPRRLVIEIQTKLVRPDVSTSATTLQALAAEVLSHIDLLET